MVDFDERRDSVLSRYDNLASTYGEAANKFSLLAVTNLILINAGGLVALANGIFGKGISPPAIQFPAGGFVTGLVLALLCAFVAYQNFRLLAGQTQTFMNDELWRHEKLRLSAIAAERGMAESGAGLLADGRSYAEFAKEADAALTSNKSRAAKYNFDIQMTIILGQVTGLGSGAAFIIACWMMIGALQ